MNYTIMWIMIAFMVVLFFLTIFLIVPWREIFEKMYGNNPLKAKVYVEAGEQINFSNGSYYGSTEQGVLYTYKYKGIRYCVHVPDNYPFRFVMGRRKIRVEFGHADPSPHGVNGKYSHKVETLEASALGESVNTKLPISGDALEKILRARVGAELVSSVFGKAVNWVMLVVVFACIVGGGFFIYKNMVADKTPPPVQTNTPGQTINPNAGIEEKLIEEGAIK